MNEVRGDPQARGRRLAVVVARFNELVTAETPEQATDRAGGKHGNKGWDAAMAAMEMASLLQDLPQG